MTTFADLGVRSGTLSALTRQGIVEPLAVQEAALPALLARRDAVIQAPTGSGKTLAFAIPLVEHLNGHASGGPRALVVVPTRELATQIATVIASIDRRLRTTLLFGGVGYGVQLAALRGQPDVVVGCPGRILDLAERGAVRFGAIRHLVLDEADEMLDQGFARDVERIIALTPPPGGRQTVLASATMPDWVQRMIDRHLLDPLRVAMRDVQEPALEHGLVHVGREQRIDVLSRLLHGVTGSAIVFHRTKHGARKLARDLARLGHATGELQGNLSQNARDRAIADFRALRTRVLVATNVAARGLDIAHVELVINFELPESAQWLTHRVGRTARNGAEGRALTFLADEDMMQWRKLRRDGAPELPWVDLEALVDRGAMTPIAADVQVAAAASWRGDGRATAVGRREGVRRTVTPASRQRTRAVTPPRAPSGTITKLVTERGFGFIESADGTQYFFHRSNVVDDFDGLRRGRRVTFEVEPGGKGPRAARVRAAA